MSFKEFFKEGMQAADNLEASRKEIEEVFKQLDQDIKEVTNGKISILITREYEYKENVLNLPPVRMNDIINQTDSRIDFISGQVLVTGKVFSQRIAKFKTSDDGGYPCSIIYRNNNASAYDKESLITILGDLISSPGVAFIFKDLLKKSD